MPNAASGRSAQRRGQDAQRRASHDIRGSGHYPNADHVGTWPRRPGVGDLTGIGDNMAEITVRPWSELDAKLAQAEDTARVGGQPWWFVMKPRRRLRGRPWPNLLAGWTLTFRGDVGWALLARVGALEAERVELLAERDEALARADEAYHRGVELARAEERALREALT